MKKIGAWTAVVVLMVPVAAWAFLSPKNQAARELALFSGVLELVRTDFVDETSAPSLVGAAISGMLHSLDPYSQYLDREAFRELQNANEGRFGGIGLEFSLKDGVLMVIAPLDGTPAALAGLRPGDRILKIDSKLTHDMTLADASRALRGEPGTTVALSVLRESEKSVLDVPVQRARIRVPGVKEARILEPGVGYVRVSSFQRDTARDLREALQRLRGEGATRLILDLRNNPGGPLDAALGTAELFVPAGKILVTTRGRNPSKNSTRTSRAKNPLTFRPLVVLVNKGSASDAEIVAGALKDHALGVLVGTKTYGKGSIQSVIPIGDGTAVRLTTSRYYTPSGAVIHERGIDPDVVVEEQPGADAPLARALEIVRSGL